jgi:hypothetical protein
MLRQCFRCTNYRVVEEQVGYCKLFGDTVLARQNEALCGRMAKWFVPQRFVPKSFPVSGVLAVSPSA